MNHGATYEPASDATQSQRHMNVSWQSLHDSPRPPFRRHARSIFLVASNTHQNVLICHLAGIILGALYQNRRLPAVSPVTLIHAYPLLPRLKPSLGEPVAHSPYETTRGGDGPPVDSRPGRGLNGSAAKLRDY
jgi:hypothetical protein